MMIHLLSFVIFAQVWYNTPFDEEMWRLQRRAAYNAYRSQELSNSLNNGRMIRQRNQEYYEWKMEKYIQQKERKVDYALYNKDYKERIQELRDQGVLSPRISQGSQRINYKGQSFANYEELKNSDIWQKDIQKKREFERIQKELDEDYLEYIKQNKKREKYPEQYYKEKVQSYVLD